MSITHKLSLVAVLVLVGGAILVAQAAPPLYQDQGQDDEDGAATIASTANKIVDGVVFPANPWLNLRPAPTGHPGEVVGVHINARLVKGDVVEVLPDAPQCVDGYTWYHVRLTKRSDGTPMSGPDGWISAQIWNGPTMRPDPCCSAVMTVPGGAYLRTGPSRDFPTCGPPLGQYGVLDFERYTVDAQSLNWYHIFSNYIGWAGWIPKTYVAVGGACASVPMQEEPPQPTLEALPTTEAAAATTCRLTINAPGGVLMRTAPNAQSTVVSYNLVEGSIVTPRDRRAGDTETMDWWRVVLDGTEGWIQVHIKFVEQSGDCDAFQTRKPNTGAGAITTTSDSGTVGIPFPTVVPVEVPTETAALPQATTYEAVQAKIGAGDIRKFGPGENGLIAWGVQRPDGEYISLGWTWPVADGIDCSVPADVSLLTRDEFCLFARNHSYE